MPAAHAWTQMQTCPHSCRFCPHKSWLRAADCCVAASRRKELFIAVAVDIIRFQSYGLQDNVALLVLLHRKGESPLQPFLHLDKHDIELLQIALGCFWLLDTHKGQADNCLCRRASEGRFCELEKLGNRHAINAFCHRQCDLLQD